MRFLKAMGTVFFAVLVIITAGTQGALAKELLEIVPNKKVCMVTNMVFPRDQIPVKYAGRTYYGCCENCKKTLAEDVTARVALDPLSKKPVDKASAVIAARPDGSVIYFENQASFQRYTKGK